jgi:UDP-4-amino-4-deoxy-L-arabinose-oxoglutarate aminotransferase
MVDGEVTRVEAPWGQPADLDALRALAAERGIPVIEDAAHAVGAAYRGVEIGASGEIVVFSFHPIKNVTTGEGGMVVARDDARAARIRLLSFACRRTPGPL